MAVPAALQNSLELLYQGPVSVVFDPSGGDEVELFTRGGLDLTFIRGLEAAEIDVLGTYDLYSSGDAVEFTLTMPERSVNVVGRLFPDGVDASAYASPYIGFGRTAGQSMRSNAKKVRIRPWRTRTSDDEQIELWVVVPNGDATLSQQVTEPHSWSQPFRALPDPTKGDGEMIGHIYTKARS